MLTRCSIASLATALAFLFTTIHVADAFVPSRRFGLLPPGRPASPEARSSALSMSSIADSSKAILVISPPGGIGEVAAISAAKLGNSVRWFVVSPDSASSSAVSLPSSVLSAISDAGGSIELAGADAPSLLLPPDDASSAIGAVAKWCGTGDGIICAFDGTEQVSSGDDGEDSASTLMDAIKVAAREAAGVVSTSGLAGRRVAVLPAPTADEEDASDEDSGIGGVFKSILGKGDMEVPSSLEAALGGESSIKVSVLRHGNLFGVPESSPDASPFVGGPRRDPTLRDEYTMRSVRIDPTISASGTAMMGSTTRSSRLSLGEAAARLALSSVPITDGSDVFLTSLNGMDVLDSDDWNDEFARCEETMSSGAGAQLFKATFESVPDVERLADWVATKWAPAVLRTYDLAGIRVGARPVYASRTGDGVSEIVWQQLVDFQSVTVGRMIIEVTKDSIIAKRGPGDPASGYGSISLKPLAGEDVLIRRLADAATQAIEKGLAKKPTIAKKPKPEPKKAPVAAPVSTTVAASGDVAPAREATPSLESGPRTAGARRSSERTRGKRRKSPPPKTQESDSGSKSNEEWQ